MFQKNTNTSYQSTIVYRADAVTAAAAAASTTITFSYSARPDFTLIDNVSSDPSVTWTPATGLDTT
ncbi:hypothetical protein, partial [Salmonella sp. SAL4431]|uniref:hypothetical protein n=1 Tax=Salmonella sp. SAL4431 TaxID=3159886 RepID=UPI00397D3027